MQLSRMLPGSWGLPIALALLSCVACEGSPPAQTSSGSKGETSAPPVTTATANSSTPVKSETLPSQASVDQATTPPAGEVNADVRNANAFTFKMLARIKKATENALVSGTSLRESLGTTYLGARGTTAREMATALALDNDPKIAARLARAELDGWQDAKGKAELNIASRLWIDKGFALQPDFVASSERSFGAAPAAVDYAKPDDARKTINAWVAEKTKDKITDLLPSGSVDARTRLVVTNAIWFKGSWQYPFPKGATKDEAFKTDASKSVTTPMMHLTDSFRVAQVQGLKVLEMRYQDSALTMLVVLPDDAGGLSKIEPTIDADTLDGWTGALKTARVNVTLPKFGFRSGGTMNGPLQDAGMKTAFTDKADFGGIADAEAGERLYINQVFHQTWIAVDELGTEAAAATGTTMRTTSLITGPIVEFKADHPFLFLIRDSKYGRLLFAGRVTNPK